MNQIKIAKILFLATLFPALSLAKTSDPMPHGFYLGASTAITSTTIKNQLTFNSSEVENAALYTRNQYGSTTQVQPGFLLGYEHVFNKRWLVGGEVQANFLKSYVNFSGADYTDNTITANNQYAAQLRIGTSLTCDDNFIYGLVGIARTQTNVKILFDNTNLTVGALGNLQLQPLNKSRNLNGLKLGVGYEKHLNKNLGIRVDYSHTQYGSIRSALEDMTFFDILPDLGASRITQSTDMLNLTVLFIT